MMRRLIVLVLLCLISRETRSEWVEIPQFSDRDKVYKLPLLKFPQQQQQKPQQLQQHVFNEATIDDGKTYYKVSFQKDESLRNVSAFSDDRRPNFTDEPSFDATLASFTTERTVSTISVEDNDDDQDVTIIHDDGIKVSFETGAGQMPQFDKPLSADVTEEVEEEDEDGGDDAMDSVTTKSSVNKSKSPQYNNETDNDKGFLDYLPVDLLKRVHKTLKSQPPNLKGKIRFLKMFERTLLGEIESRLSLALAPSRKPRGARGGGHGHDEGLGFPSLEGTLMAISFLTFAVYLVRLVMMLFQTAKFNNPSTMTPVIIGRKRRSVDDFNEETARILSYLDSSLPRQY